MSTRLLSPEDIYDVYGCEWVLTAANLEQDDQQLIDFRLREIQDIYVQAAKSRIRAEAVFLGIKLGKEEFSFNFVLDLIGKNLESAMANSAESMMRGGKFNLMGTILQAHQAAGRELKGIDLKRFGVEEKEPERRPDVDPNWFMNIDRHAGKHVFDDPKWAEIAKAYLAVEAAKTSKTIIASIDRLNQLQHNSFHVLIDLQTGRMLTKHTNASNDRDARKRLQEVLDVKLKAKSPAVFLKDMSSEIQGLMKKYRGATLKINE